MAVQTFITDKGADLIAKALAGGFPIAFVGAEIGTGSIGVGEDAKEYTALKVKYANAMLSSTVYEGNATCKFSAQYTESGIIAAVLITEIGIFATDPDLGPVLFTYTNLGDDPDRLFPSNQASFYKYYDVVLTFSATNGVTVDINPSSLVPASLVVGAPAANKLLRLDGEGKLPASITGDADTVDGKHAADFATAGHRHDNSTPTADGFMSKEDKIAHNTLVSRVNQGLNTTSSPTFAGMTVNGVINGASFL